MSTTQRGAPPRPEFLTISDVTELLQISRDTVARLVGQGQLAAYRLPSGRPRFRRTDVVALLTPVSSSETALPDSRSGAARR